MTHIKYTQATWWTWAVITVLLLWGLFTGDMWARQAAMGIAAAQAAFYLLRHRSLRHFPTQLRVAYALWMAASFVPELFILYWIQSAGSTALVLTGYCPLARVLLVFPWNREVPLTWRRLATIVFHPPIHGSVVTGLPL